MTVSHRDILIGLSAATPLASVLSGSARAADDESTFLKVSRVIGGRQDLDPKIALRIEQTLADNIQRFPAKLTSLATALAGKERDAALERLNETDLDQALKIAQPWDTGVSGQPALTGCVDDARFVTFLGAEAYRLLQDVMPFPSYPTGAPGWWAEVPAGVTAPPMPAAVRDWNFVPVRASGSIATADPEFLVLVTPKDAAPR